MLTTFMAGMAYMRSYRNSQARLQGYLNSMSDTERPITPDHSGETFVYKRKKKGWESFSCKCGSPKQLSPSMQNTEFNCSNCGIKIIIVI